MIPKRPRAGDSRLVVLLLGLLSALVLRVQMFDLSPKRLAILAALPAAAVHVLVLARHES